jgi:AraC-like DNA-binding protein
MRAMAAPRLFLWRARALYLGPAFGLSPHRNAVPVLCAGVGGPFRVALDPKARQPAYLSCRLALIPANTLHHLLIDTAPMAFLYVDAQSDDFRRLRDQAARFDGRVGLGLAGESAYLAALVRLHHGGDWGELREEIAAALGLQPPARPDARIAAALQEMHKAPEESAELAALAQRAGLSPSRFLHLFKQATGVPFRRYRLWARMGAAVRSLVQGHPLTEAALAAGFSSSAHFSAAYREMFGLAPSALAQAAPALIEAASEEPAAPR